MVPEIIVDTQRNLAEQLAGRLEQEGRRALAARGRFAIALSGGSVAYTFYPRLAAAALDWPRIDLFWCDERAVPPDDPESNYGLVRKLWLDGGHIPAERIHRMEAETGNLEAAADAYADELIRLLGSPPRLDVAILGVGEDGHVCSLFPGDPLLSEERRWTAAIANAPKPPPSRLTLTLPTLAAVELLVVAAFGAPKAPVIRAALDDPRSSLPLALVLRRAQRALVLLDPSAAALA